VAQQKMSHRIKSKFSATKGVCYIKISGLIGEIFVYNTQIIMTLYDLVYKEQSEKQVFNIPAKIKLRICQTET